MYFFTQILWRISPKLGTAGLATAVFSTAASLLLGRTRLERLFREERMANGIFAHNLSRCRENLESIQFADSTNLELNRIQALDKNRQLTTNLRKREKDLVRLFSSLLRQLAGGLFPPIILRSEEEDHQHSKMHNHSHAHNDGHFQQGLQVLKINDTHSGHPKPIADDAVTSLSALSQATEAFDEILYHLLIVSENFHDVIRLTTIAQDISMILDDDESDCSINHIIFLSNLDDNHAWLEVKSLDVRIPPKSEVDLVENFNVTLKYGDSLLITGPSGCGKTALLRVLFGLWPAFRGTVKRPRNDDLIVLPQKPFCSLGTLKEQVTYPKQPNLFSDEDVKSALMAVGLGHLISHSPQGLNEFRKWSEELSVGEQQRLGFARVVLLKPKFGFFDESSSSLDMESEAKMYELVSAIVIGGFVSIGHRKSIEKYHLRKVMLLGTSGKGSWKSIF